MKIEKKNVNNFLEYILIFLIGILGLKKGGYYKQDSIILISLVMLCSLVYFILNIRDIKRNSVLFLLLLILAISYFIPIVIGNVATVSGAIMSGVKIFSAFVIYLIVYNSKEKNKFKTAIIVFAIIIGIFAIDEANFKVLEGILKIIGGGYNTGEDGRIAGVMQYSNLLGIVCLMAILFILDIIVHGDENKLKKIYMLIIPFLTAVMVLSQSKAVFALYCIFTAFYLIHEKKYELILKMILNIILATLLVSILNSILAIICIEVTTLIYIITLCSVKNKKVHLIIDVSAFFVILVILVICILQYKNNILEGGILSSFKEYFTNFNSTKLRFVYYVDSLKLNIATPLNFLFGLGGNAFRTMYETVQTLPYISLEVHSLFIQIFLEGGIVALVALSGIIIYVLKSAKFNIEKVVFITLVILATFDVFLTYTFALYIFFVCIALCDIRRDNFRIKEMVLFGAVYVIVSFILSCHVTAYCIKPNDVNNPNNTIEKQEDIICKMEIVLRLDPYDIEYRRDYLKATNTYLDILDTKNELYGIDITQYRTDTIQKIYNSIKLENKYEKSNKYAIEDYMYYTYKYLDDLVFINYSENSIQEGYEKYLKELVENIDRLRLEHGLNDYAQSVILNSTNMIYDKYSYVNMMLNSDTISNTLNTIKEIII